MLALPPRYELRRTLGRGGMGEVSLVYDRERDQEVALKCLLLSDETPSAAAEEARFLFKQEFAAMATLRHPHLVEAYDYGLLADGTPYFTMEAVPGTDLGSGEAIAEDSMRAWLPGILRALGFLHARGYLHSDLKPENIRIREDGLPKLMDLGLLSRPGRGGGPIRGSLHYVAPELARGQAVDARADLYALGAVLFHVLTGRPPFDPEFKAGPIELLRAHLSERPPGLRACAPTVSAEMEALVLRLLAKDPAARFASAASVLAALGVVGDDLEPAALLQPPLIGREQQLEELARAAAAPGSLVITLLGGPGAGKSSLLAEWRAEAQLQGLKTFVAQGLGADAPPYQALRPWLRALSADPTPELERLAPVLVRVLPELGVEAAPALEGGQERVRLHSAVAELASTLAPEASWLLDDADKLDPASAALVTFLRARGGACRWHWVLTRQEDAQEPGRTLVLAPLEEAQALEMAQAMLATEHLPEALVERLPVLSGGNPGAVGALLTHWVASGALARTPMGWEVEKPAQLVLPENLTLVLDARFAACSDSAQRLGRIAGLLGSSGALSLLSELADSGEIEFFQALSELESSDTLRQSAGEFSFQRPAQAQALAATWPPEEARAWHSRAARLLIQRTGLQPEEPTAALDDLMAIARHSVLGEAPQESLPWTFAAAHRARALYALGSVLPLIEQSLSLPALSLEDQATLYDFWVTLLRAQGQVDEAVRLQETYVMPVARHGDPAHLAHHLTNLGVLHQLKGRYDQALECLSEAINLADTADASATRVRARLFAGRSAYFSGQSKLAATVLGAAVRIGREASGNTLLGSALSLYGYVLATNDSDRFAEGVALLEEAIAYNTAVDNNENLLEACNNLGNLYLSTGRFKEALPTFERCLLLSERIAMHNERVFALINLGATYLDTGRPKETLGLAQQAAEQSRKQGRKFPEAYALALQGLALIHQGELTAGSDKLDLALRIANEINNRYLELNVYARRLDALLHLGHLAQARQELEKARALAEANQSQENDEKFARTEAILDWLEAKSSASERLLALLDTAKRGENKPALVQALYWQAAWLHREGDDDVALNMLTEAAELAAVEELIGPGAQIRHLWGRILMPLDPGAAAEKFQEGRALAQAAGLTVTDILCQAGYGRVHPAGRDDRQEAPRRLNALLASCDEADREAYLVWPERRALLEDPAVSGNSATIARLHHLTDVIAAITAQPDLPRLMQQALVSMVDIAGAERGFLLLYNGFEVTQQVFHGMDERDNDEFSSSLAHQVLWSGEPLFVEDASSHTAFASRDSVQALSLRSVVAVPLHDGHETLGVMMADSQRINARFGPEEMDLVLALAKQVAISISHSRRLERYRNAHEENQLLYRLALRLLRAITLEDGFTAIAGEAIPLCAMSRAILLEGGDHHLRLAIDATGQTVPTTAQELSLSVTQWVYGEGKPLYLVDAQSDENFQSRASILALGLHSIYAVPIRVHGEIWGVLYLDHPSVVEENPRAAHTLVRIGEMLGAFLERGEPGSLNEMR